MTKRYIDCIKMAIPDYTELVKNQTIQHNHNNNHKHYEQIRLDLIDDKIILIIILKIMD